MRRTYYRHSGGGIAAIIALLFGFRVVLAVLGVAFAVIGSVIAGLAAAFSGVMAGIGSALSGMFAGSEVLGGLAVGTAIGLIAHRMIRAKKEQNARAAETETKAEEKAEPRETEVAETPHYRFYA